MKYEMPALLSLFIPGLGQLVKGQVLKGIALFILTIIGYSILIIPGIIVHVWVIVDAYNHAAN